MAERLVARALELCTEDGTGARPELWPKPDTVTVGIRSDGHEFEGIQFAPASPEGKTTELSYVEAIAAVTGRQMETDDRVFVAGEEVGHMGGGAYKATKGLSEIYPGRILDTPISEAGFSGFGCGAAMAGLRPIIEIMFPDFVLVAADQVLNHVGKLRHMYGGEAPIPIVFRTRCAIGFGYGGQHSGDPVGIFALFPGWRIVAPVTPYDYIGMFNSAMRCEDPVLVLEHASLYDLRGEVPRGDLDYLLPLDEARVVKPGDKVTVLAYSAMVTRIEALAKDDDAVELIDLRALDMASMDFDAIGASLQKTGALVIVDEATRSGSVGAMIADQCQRRFFDYLDGPILRVTGADAPKPVSRVLEQAAIPSDSEILGVIARAARREE
ncbi:MAG: transketolase C-terminal domain-containing protein [Phycisphaerae bacterium]|jgi:2-oxoisovalerate dehydrogenase E1 component|nr:transketolase C-terminal domain-containing protein [Phycisphaerae bacterium]